MAEFKSFAAIFAQPPPTISPLIAEPAPPTCELPHADEERAFAAHLAERIDSALQTLLREIACEVLGRELLLAPVDLQEIVRRLRSRYGISDDAPARTSPNGDVAIVTSRGEIDAALGRRLAAAIDRAAP